MGINLDQIKTRSITKIQKKYNTPKSIRLNNNEIMLLEELKIRILNITLENNCSDTQVFKMLLRLTKYVKDNRIKQALSEMI